MGSSQDRRFFTAADDEILSGKVTDVYFLRGRDALLKEGIDPYVYGEVTASSLPDVFNVGIFAGLEEVLRLLEGHPVTVRAIPEGNIFYPKEPVITIEGKYSEFGVYETSFLGFVCFSSGVATRAAHIKAILPDKPVYSFGARRMHPAVAPAVERAAYIGGCDGVATVAAAEVIGEKPVGTMAHAFIISAGDPLRAYRIFDKHVEPEIPRITLIDTYEDEKFGAITAIDALGEKLFAVRLDTPGSRRGNFRSIIEEVRWELDYRGYKNVKIFVSGGLDINSIKEIKDVADAFGVGTYISNAKVVDFAFDIVEKEGKPAAKRGKKSGRKTVFECERCLSHFTVPVSEKIDKCPGCGGNVSEILKTYISGGKRVVPEEKPQVSRERTLSYIRKLNEIDRC